MQGITSTLYSLVLFWGWSAMFWMIELQRCSSFSSASPAGTTKLVPPERRPDNTVFVPRSTWMERKGGSGTVAKETSLKQGTK
jgi:hypothetical protein